MRLQQEAIYSTSCLVMEVAVGLGNRDGSVVNEMLQQCSSVEGRRR